MTIKSVEVYYNVNRIPGLYPGDWDAALDFRNAAMELIENALIEARAGEWAGAEIGSCAATGEPEVNFGFDVADFDMAEEIIRSAVAGTPYEGIREITRREIDEGELH
ncbi:hypothetical protein [Vannielia litorea]|uniref:hypothetical protein n=1 Tax=Vannielia litorea TaxID=1217970 RepID=UPI001BCB1041|nr:hypothetical protein [Vannielia litorea]MBS8227764.1 hypothetical protein [Vannielia litorea]